MKHFSFAPRTAISLAIALMLTGATALKAQEISESHLATARAAIGSIKATDQFDNILPNAATQMKSELIPNNPDMQNEISNMVDDKAIALASRRADLENEIARVYARTFSEPELKAIVDFYSSEAGMKLLAEGPTVTREALAAADVWSNGIIRDLRQASLEGINELNAANAPVPTAEGESQTAAPTTPPEAGGETPPTADTAAQ